MPLMMASITAVGRVSPQLTLLHRPPLCRGRLCRQLCSSSGRRPGPGYVVGRPSRTSRAHDGRQQRGRQLHADASALGATDAHFLAGLLRQHPEVVWPRAHQPPLGGEDGHKRAAAARQPWMPAFVALEPPAENRFETEKTQELPKIMQNALLAMQQKDCRRLLACLREVVGAPEEKRKELVALLPQTTFSAFLRSLDPKDIAPEVDPTLGTYVSVGMWKHINMYGEVDEYGTRRVMLQLMDGLLMLATTFQDLGRIMITEDHIHLIRAAGAAGDMEGARLLWRQLGSYAANVEWKKGDAYNEFIKARYHTDPIAYGYDKTKVSALKPRNLHRHGYVRLHMSVRRLDRLRLHLRRNAAYFGLDRRITHAEDISRRLRKKMSVTRFFWYVIRKGHRITEETLCSFIVAFARANALHFMQNHILADYFGIRIWNDDKTSRCEIQATKRRSGRYKNPLRPEPHIKPTERLLHAVVEAYSSNGRLGVALRLVDYIHRVFRVKVPEQVWFDLLEWAQTLRSKPVRTGWKMAGYHAIIPEAFTVGKIWKIMTSPPFSVQPGFDQYVILARHLIARHAQGLQTTREAMEKLRGYYDEQCRVYERAVFAYVRVLGDGVDVGPALTALNKARFRKSYMWFKLSETCHQYLQNYRPATFQALAHVQPRHLPCFVNEFRHFLPATVNYRIKGGYVSLRDTGRPEALVTTRRYPMEVPMPYMNPPKVTTKSLQQFRHNRHSLAMFRNTKLDPLPMLLASKEAFRPTNKLSPRARKLLRRMAHEEIRLSARRTIEC